MNVLPRPVQPWRALLQELPDAAADTVAPMVGRLRALIGPMLHAPEPGGDTPDGVAGLARRGPWERLLATEWSLADVAPEEFLRRATSGEQLFRELAYLTPRHGLHCQVLLDAGPDQLGEPRIVQLALLVVLAARAADAGASFRWCSLQHAGAPREGFERSHVLAHFSDRSLADPSPEDAARHLPPKVGPGGEIWVIGGPRAQELTVPGAHRVRIVPPDASDETQLHVQLLLARGGRRAVALPRLAPTVSKIVFRRPHEAEGGLSAPPRYIPVRLTPGFRFSHEGTRLVGRDDGGWIVGIRVARNDVGGGRRLRIKRRFARPEPLIALGWHDQKPIWIIQPEPGGARFDGLATTRSWGMDVDLPADAIPGDLAHFVRGDQDGTHREIWFITPDRRLYAYRYTDPNPPGDPVSTAALALGRRNGLPLTVTADGATTELSLEGAATDRFPHSSERAWIGPDTSGLREGDRIGLVGAASGLVVRVRGLGEPFDIPIRRDDRFLGITWLPEGSRPVAALLTLDPTGVLELVGRGFRVPLPGAVGVVWACASPGTRPQVAWMHHDGRVAVFDMIDFGVTQSLRPGQG